MKHLKGKRGRLSKFYYGSMFSHIKPHYYAWMRGGAIKAESIPYEWFKILRNGIQGKEESTFKIL